MKKISYLAIPEAEDREAEGDEVIAVLHSAADDFTRRVLKHPETLEGEFDEDIGTLIWSCPVVSGGISCQLRQNWNTRTIFVYAEGFGDSVIAVPYEAQQSALYALVQRLPRDKSRVSHSS